MRYVKEKKNQENDQRKTTNEFLFFNKKEKCVDVGNLYI